MNPAPPSLARASGPPALIWWIIWAMILIGVTMIYVFLGQRPRAAPPVAIIDYIGAGEVIISGLLRWLWLPRLQRGNQAFVFFIIGIALADGCAILGIFLSPRPTELFALGVLGVVQWAPIFAGRFSRASAASPDAHGFR